MNVIVGATLSVMLTVKFVWDGVPKLLLAVTLPSSWVPPSYAEPDIFDPKVTYPEASILKKADDEIDQVTAWSAVNLALVPD